MQVYHFNTGNPNKQREISQMLERAGVVAEFNTTDFPELHASPEIVAARKAWDAYQSAKIPILVEDVSFEVEGEPAENSVLIKFQLGRLSELVGRRAIFRVIFAGVSCPEGLDELGIFLFKGEIPGVICEAKGKGEGFGFDSNFIPEGSDQPLSLHKPDHLNARWLALIKVLGAKPDQVILPEMVSEIPGPWQ